MKTDLFQSCGHCWVFQICWHVECSTLTASSFKIWNSSTGVPSPPLVLFIVMFPAAAKSLQSCPTLCDPMDCSLPGFSVHGILHARTLEWVAISFSHLTSHSRMSDSRWVITPSWLSGSWSSFLYSSSALSCHLFLISSASFRSVLFSSYSVWII